MKATWVGEKKCVKKGVLHEKRNRNHENKQIASSGTKRRQPGFLKVDVGFKKKQIRFLEREVKRINY